MIKSHKMGFCINSHFFEDLLKQGVLKMDKFCGLCGSMLNYDGKCPNPECKSNMSELTRKLYENQNHADDVTRPLPHIPPAESGVKYKYEVKPEPKAFDEVKKSKRSMIIAVCSGVLAFVVLFTVLSCTGAIDVPFMQNIFSSSQNKDGEETDIAWEDSEYNALRFIGMKIEDAADFVGGMWNEEGKNGKKCYTDGDMTFETNSGEKEVFCISIDGNSKYQICGISLDDEINDAREKMQEADFTEKRCEIAGAVEFKSKSGELVRLYNNDGEVSKMIYWENSGKITQETTEDYSQETEPEETQPPQDTGSVNDSFKYASASSVLPSQGTFSYGPGNVLDDDPNTCWAEGASGTGVGERIVLSSDTPQTVSGLNISNGYCKSSDAFYSNNRLKEINIIFDDGRSMTASFRDGYEYRFADVEFSESVTTSTITIEILSVYTGEDQKDACVSDISVY